MNDSHIATDAAAKPESTGPAMYRLVIRADIIPDEAPEESQPPSTARRLALIAGAIAVVLIASWVGIKIFATDAPSVPTAARELESPVGQTRAESQVVATQSPATATQPALASSSSIDAKTSETKSIESSAHTQLDAPPASTNEVIPTASHNALQTIRGTVRVAVRVTIDKHGAVIAAASEDPGPSRYFERVSLEASRKWTFTPTSNDESRSMLLRFHFTREGATARAEAAK